MVNEGKREFRVDSGASVPMAGESDLTPEEAHTMPASKTLCEPLTAHGTVFTSGEATVHFEDLDMFVTVQLLGDSPAVLSLGRLCVENGYTYEWNTGESSYQESKNGKKDEVSGGKPWSTGGPWSSFDEKSGPEQTALGNASLELPEWLEPFTEGISEGASSSSTDAVPTEPPPAPASQGPPAMW